MSFYMVLPSNGCRLTQPDNKASSYFTDWESEVVLNGKWEVALTEFSLNSFPIIKPGGTIHYTYKTVANTLTFWFNMIGKYLEINKELMIYEDNELVIQMNAYGHLAAKYDNQTPFKLVFETDEEAALLGFPSKTIHSVDDIVVSPSKIKQFKPNQRLKMLMIPDKLVDRTEEIRFKEYMVYTKPSEFEAYIKLHCSKVFDQFKINQNGYLTFTILQNINSVVLSENISAYFGFGAKVNNMVTKKNVTYTSTRKPLLAKSFNQLFIYTSIIDPVFVGGVQVPLLRTIWVQNKYDEGSLIHENIDYPMYLPVCSNSINNIEIQIRDDSGELIQFPYGSLTTLTLHFRKK